MLNLRKQRNRVDTASIQLPENTTPQWQGTFEDDDKSIASEPLASEPGSETPSPRLRELTKKINQAFVEYRVGESSLASSSLKVLQLLCHSRGLGVDGYKADLAARLISWV